VINGVDKYKYSKFNNNVCVIIFLYVDDLLIFGISDDVVQILSVFLPLNLI
jgi:hypothetical protein